MNLHELQLMEQTNYVSNPMLSPSQLIVYTHANAGLLKEQYALVSEGEYNSKEKDKTLNEITLDNLILPYEPTKLDTFMFNEKEWKVRWWRGSNGMYQIKADNGKKNGGGRYGR